MEARHASSVSVSRSSFSQLIRKTFTLLYGAGVAGHAAEDASESCLVRVGRSGSRAGAAGAVGVGVAVMSDGLEDVPCVIQLETIMGAAQMRAAIVRLRLSFGNHRPWGPRRRRQAIWAEKMHFCNDSNSAVTLSRASLCVDGLAQCLYNVGRGRGFGCQAQESEIRL